MKARRHFIFIFSVMVMGLLISPVTRVFSYAWWESFGNPCRWEGAAATMDLHPVSFWSGSPWTNNMVAAMTAWNNVIGSRFHFNWKIQKRDINDHGDGHTAVAFVRSHCDDWAGITYRRTKFLSSKVKEADILFDVDCSWVSSSPNKELDVRAQGPQSFRDVAQHELGHALGLDHEFGAVAIMNYGYIFERLQGDDKNGARFLYPRSGTETDLSVTNAVDDGPGGWMRYVKAPSPQQAEPGEAIQIEYTVQNMGNVALNHVGVGFYLDNYLLDRSYFDFPVHSIGTFTRTLVIPSSIPLGDYRLYVYIDDTNNFRESDESNNCLQNPWGVFSVYLGPSAPGELVANPPSPNHGAFTLSWAPSRSFYSIDHYQLSHTYWVGQTLFMTAFPVSGTSCYFTNLPIGDHTFWMEAVDVRGQEGNPSPTKVIRVN